MTEEAFATDVSLQSVSDLTTLTMSESMSLIRAGTLAPTDLVIDHLGEMTIDRLQALFL